MGASVVFVFVLLLLVSNGSRSIGMTFGDVKEILNFSHEILIDVFNLYNKKPPSNKDQFPLFVQKIERELINSIGSVERKISSFEDKFEHNSREIIEVVNKLPKHLRFNSDIHNLWFYISQVENSYHKFFRYAITPEKYEAYTMEDFAKNTLSSNLNALPNTLDIIHCLVLPCNRTIDLFHNSILRFFGKHMEEASEQMCNTKQSPQQLLYNLYNIIALTQIKGYIMMQFSWTLLKLYKAGNFTEEMEQLKQDYTTRASEILRAVKTAMAMASRDIWMCDPSEHNPEKTYTNLSQVFQGFIVNEVDMNPQGTCKENCGYYSYAKVYGCYQNQFCAGQRPCNGKLINCQYIDSDMTICPSEKSSNRRYEYIDYENGMTFGTKKTCPRSTSKVDSWWRWLFWHCSYCMCYCDDHNSSSDRYFNLRDVTSDVKNNKVVTGVRLTKQNQIIHIQIQQAVLLPYGNINSSTVDWKKIDNYTITDSNVKDRVDYHTIMWEKRAVDLDDLDSPVDHLLTGLRFRVVGAHLNLEIHMTPFNFTTGSLSPEMSLWHSHDTTEASEMYDLNGEIRQGQKRTELKLNKPDIPTKSLAQSVPDSQTNQFLLFVATDLEKDAAQNTVPFIDTQAIIPSPPVPISGAGIFHKGRDGFGGFLALKLITYNFEPQLQADIKPPVPAIEISNDINTI